jgi:signal transduction histidine kinase
VDLALFRVAQEALRNAEDHAAATEIDLRLCRRGARVSVTVRDNGIGLAKHFKNGGSGTGFLEMRQRMRSVGGNLAVRSRPSLGTAVVASVPTSTPPAP